MTTTTKPILPPAFSKLMEAKLQENKHKRHWSTCEHLWLLARMVEEVGELSSLMNRDRGLPEGASVRAIARECADVANFAMMIADNYGGLDDE